MIVNLEIAPSEPINEIEQLVQFCHKQLIGSSFLPWKLQLIDLTKIVFIVLL